MIEAVPTEHKHSIAIFEHLVFNRYKRLHGNKLMPKTYLSAHSAGIPYVP